MGVRGEGMESERRQQSVWGRYTGPEEGCRGDTQGPQEFLLAPRSGPLL